MKIALVCGHFIPALGYIEVHLARAFAELGHQISVFTSDRVPAYAAELNRELGSLDGVEIHRFSPFFELGQMVVARGLNDAVIAFKPDLMVLIGLGKLFPAPVLDLDYPKLILLGDNAHSYAQQSLPARMKNAVLLNFLKKRVYRKAARSDGKMVAYTPESFEAASKLLGSIAAHRLRKEKRFISLGFWPDEFYFDRAARQELRQNMGVKEGQHVLITATRIVPEKRLEEALAWIKDLPEHMCWWLVGSDQSAYSTELGQKATTALGARFKIIPFLAKAELRSIYSAADTAVYTIPAISVFEAMGTGLRAILPETKSLSHIIQSENDGKYYAALSAVVYTQLGLITHDDQARVSRAIAFAARFGWIAQAENLLGFKN